MIKDLLPPKIYNLIESQFSFKDVEEIRLRANLPLVVCVCGKNYVAKSDFQNYYLANDDDINFVLSKATQNSMYVASDQIKQMYVSYYGGIRIGICGEFVKNNNQVMVIKHVASINIRIPHEVRDFANVALNFIENGNKINSTLIASAPGAGKTTLLRDIARALSSQSKARNVLIVDERNEIAACVSGRPTLDVGLFSDVISGGDKMTAFSFGIRSMKPEVIITDELGTKEDYEAVKKAVQSGVAVIASVHAKDQYDLLKNPLAKDLISSGCISRIIVLSQTTKSRYVGIYDSNFKCIYMPY